MRDLDVSGETRDVIGTQSDGSGLRRITQAAPDERFRGARWTPDGTVITAFADAEGSGVLIDPSDGSFERFATGAGESPALVRPTTD